MSGGSVNNCFVDFVRRRTKNYSLIFLFAYIVYFTCLLFLIKNSLIGIDFSAYYSVGKLATEGNARLIYDLDIHHNVLESVLGREIPFMLGWFYPPIFLLIVTTFAFLPYKSALFIWTFITFIIYLFAVKKISLSNKGIYIAMGFPGVLMNFHWGQNALLTTALFGLGIYYTEKKPLLAGLMFSVLCYKPHFALFTFVILLLSKRWKTLMWSVLFGFLLMIISSGVFGVETWIEYIKSQLNSPDILLGSVWKNTVGMQPTLYSFLRLIGIHAKYALSVQGIVALIMLFLSWWTWKHISSISVKGIILVISTLLCTPYFGQYDLVLLILPLIWYLNDCKLNGWLKWDLGVLILLWFRRIYYYHYKKGSEKELT